MSYVKQTWIDNVSIANAERMNHIEEGIYEANQQQYSTNETVIGKWIDNKTLYRKVFNIIITENNTDVTIPNSHIDNLEQVVSINGIIKNSFGNFFPIPNVNPNGQLVEGNGIYYHSASNGVVIRIGNLSLGVGANTYVILEYTKTNE